MDTLKFLFHHQFTVISNPIKKNDAIQVVVLVLENNRWHPGKFCLDLAAVLLKIGHLY